MTKRSPTKPGQRRIPVVNSVNTHIITIVSTHIHKVHVYYQFCPDEHGYDGLKQTTNV